MKIIVKTILIISLFLPYKLFAAQSCEDYITNEWPISRYTIESIVGDKVVTDIKTGLLWKQCSQGFSGMGCANDSNETYTWNEALNEAVSQNNIGFAGYTDWRLPNINELNSILAYNCINPPINEEAFPNTPNEDFWSSSPTDNAPFNAWSIIFSGGFFQRKLRTSRARVRLVRN